jgi:hypothetical protein
LFNVSQELLVDSSNMEMEDLEKLADDERLAWSGADQNEEFSGSEEMQDCLVSGCPDPITDFIQSGV